MKTTLEIPDDLFRLAKARAALQGRSLKELFTVALSNELERDHTPAEPVPAKVTLHDRMNDVCGIGCETPPDLLTNPVYLDDFGK